MAQDRGPVQVKRGTAAEWAAAEAQGAAILLDGELGYDDDADLFRVGDGMTPWSQLPVYGGALIAEAQTLLASATSILQQITAIGVGDDTRTAALVNSPASATGQALTQLLQPLQRRRVVDAADYVSSGMSAAQMRTALQSALTAAKGGTLNIPSGTYTIEGSLTPDLVLPTAIHLDAGARVIQTLNVPTINHVGSFTAPVPITAGAVIASETVTLSDVTGVTAGVALLISSDDAMPNISTVKEGMLRVVRSVSGNDVTLDSALYVSLPTNPVARIVNLVPRVAITGEGEFLHASPSIMKKALLQFTAARDPRVAGVSLHDSGGPGLQLDHVLGGSTEDIRLWELLDDSSTGHFGYGVNLGGTTRNFRVGSGTATNVRHGVTTNGGPQTDMAGTTFTAGGPEANSISAEFIVTGNKNAGFDTHEPGYGNIIDGVAVGCVIGVQDRARNSIIRAKVIGAALYGYNVGEQTRGSYLDHPVALGCGSRSGGTGIRIAGLDAVVDTPTIRDGGASAINALSPYALIGDGDVKGTVGGSAGPTRRGSGLLGVVSPNTGTSAYTTTSTTFVDIDPAVFTLSITVPASGRITVRASVFMRQVTANAGAVKMVVMDVDGTGVSTPIAATGASMTESSVRIRLEYVARITGLTPGTQKTLRLGWRVIGGTGEITLAGTDTGQGVFEIAAS